MLQKASSRGNWRLEEWRWQVTLKNQIEEIIYAFLLQRNQEVFDEAMQFKISTTRNSTSI